MSEYDLYLYRIDNIRVIDGDTIDCDIDLGFDVWLHKQRIRLYGIDAPETRTKDLEEKKRGIEAKQWLEKKLDDALDVRLSSEEFNRGKFGRILGVLHVFNEDNKEWGWSSVNYEMKTLGLVKEYFGGSR